MEFTSDPTKSAANRAKHGIDFAVAEKLWEDMNRVEILGRSKGGEERWIVTGRIDASYWTAVITYRYGTIRIISVRRARPEEIARCTRG